MDHSLPICRHRRILVNVHSVPLRALYRFCPGIEPQAGFFGQRPYLLSQITRSVPGNGRERGRRRTKATAPTLLYNTRRFTLSLHSYVSSGSARASQAQTVTQRLRHRSRLQKRPPCRGQLPLNRLPANLPRADQPDADRPVPDSLGTDKHL